MFMLKKLTIGALASAVLALPGATFAQGQFGTAAEARAMIEKVVKELKANPTAALAKFNKGEGGFKDRDLYVFCFDVNSSKFTANGANQAVLGNDIKALKEKDGSPLGEKIVAAAKEGTISTVSYNFPKPGTTDPVPKESYVTRVGDQGCGVGYYK
jgi:cytochrome c